MALNRHLFHDCHVHRFVVTFDVNGWDVIEEDDSTIVRHVHREDWHMVERDIHRFDLTAFELKRDGWAER